jgi:hypothetical protein
MSAQSYSQTPRQHNPVAQSSMRSVPGGATRYPTGWKNLNFLIPPSDLNKGGGANIYPSERHKWPPSPKSIDWRIELVKSVEAAYEAAYGPGSTSPSLLSKLYSIFEDEYFLSGELISDFDEEGFIQGVLQHGEASGTPNTPGNFHDAPNESIFVEQLSDTVNYTPAGQRPDQSSDFPGVKTIRPTLHPSRRVIRRLRCRFSARNPHRYCVTRATGNKFHVCAKAGYLTITHLKLKHLDQARKRYYITEDSTIKAHTCAVNVLDTVSYLTFLRIRKHMPV